VGQIGYFFNLIFTFPIYNVLMLLDRLFGDFGFSIIILTLIIRLCLFPLTLKQLRSTKATQAIQPLMADLKKKYANDTRAQYEAMQALYKEYNISPMAGCLPLLIQLPILYGLYGAMRTVLTPGHPLTLNDVNQYIYPFLPKFTAIPSFELNWFTLFNSGWHISLAVPDPTHILPVLAALATFAQLRMSQARARQGQKDMMTQQMQIMSYIMPFVTGFIAWNFPAGLALYWTTTSVFSMVQQYFVTGWGSLFTAPPALAGLAGGKSSGSNSGKALTGDFKKAQVGKIVDSNAEVLAELSNGNGRVNGYSNGASNHRPRRPRAAHGHHGAKRTAQRYSGNTSTGQNSRSGAASKPLVAKAEKIQGEKDRETQTPVDKGEKSPKTRVLADKSEKSVETRVLADKSEKSLKTQVLSDKSEKSVETRVLADKGEKSLKTQVLSDKSEKSVETRVLVDKSEENVETQTPVGKSEKSVETDAEIVPNRGNSKTQANGSSGNSSNSTARRRGSKVSKRNPSRS
jgi:YidC/Oxa1 family membrane protein insertase